MTTRRLVLPLIGFVVIVVAVDLSIRWWEWSRPKFEAAAWRSDPLGEMGDRPWMADDLLRRRLLDGQTKEEVIEQLGEPPATPYFQDWQLVYRLGMERGFISIDSEWLVVRFDAKDRVTEYRIVRD